MSALKLFP